MLSRANASASRQPTRPLEIGSGGSCLGHASGRVLLRRLRNPEGYALGGLLAPLDCRLLVAARLGRRTARPASHRGPCSQATGQGTLVLQGVQSCTQLDDRGLSTLLGELLGLLLFGQPRRAELARRGIDKQASTMLSLTRVSAVLTPANSGSSGTSVFHPRTLSIRLLYASRHRKAADGRTPAPGAGRTPSPTIFAPAPAMAAPWS